MTASRPLTPFRHSEGPLTTPELDRLERLLISPTFHEEAMPLDMLQGMLCAVGSAPDLIPPSRWLPVALGDAPDYETKEEAEEVLGLVMRFYGQIVQELESGGVTLYVFPDEEGENDLATWCEGYLEGVLLSEADWYEHGEPEQVEEMLLPFMLLSGRMREAAEEAGEAITPEEERGLRSSAAGSIGNSVMTMYSYWLNRRIFHAPARRDGRNVGRNDPCPCGSGKAYKSCHGSSATN